MDFDLTEEQRQLQDSVGRMLAAEYEFEKRNKLMHSESGFSDAMWRTYAEQGLLAIPFAEAHGGIGGGPVETMIVMEAMGRALVLEPYLATVVMGGGAIRHAGSEEQKAALLPEVAAGSLKLALATTERHSRYNLADVATRARKDGAGWVLEGEKSVVMHGAAADKVIVTARTSAGQRDRSGIGLFLVDRTAPGVSVRSYPMQDGTRAAEISFASVRIGPEAVLGDPAGALPAVERVVEETIAATCAEAVGAMSEMASITVEYLKTRKQFGMPIGAFQALQHRGADMFVATEQARSMAMLATIMAGSEDARERSRAISAAKVQVGRSGRYVAQQAVQLHGGVGVTMEYKVGHYFKRLTTMDSLFGDADHHLGRLAAQGSILD
jgi:pimeloyl-CoA dehydrogenase small subunit